MTPDERIPVEILTGFLGSGKTTLLNRMLSDGAFRDTAVVVNELGEIGLDHLLVETAPGQVALLEGGCLCCAVVDSLPETLLDLVRRRAGGDLPRFGRIVIETTGLADPGPIMEVVRRSPLLAHFLSLGVVVTALDMLGGQGQVERHPEALRQLVLADRLVLTKLDLRGPLAPEECVWIAGANPLADVVTASDVLADPALLLAPSRGARPAVTDDHAAHSHGVRAWSFPLGEPVTRSGLAAFAAALDHRLGADLLRCKGLARTRGRLLLVQGVGARFSVTEAPPSAAEAAPHLTVIVQRREAGEIAALLPWLHVPEGTMPPSKEDLQ
ncbi:MULTISPECIES: CobW family GTP-binding protein [Novosphingobium]|jgi:G3E family GTPase|uniref:CobW family GTP-binding protein n=1 Tax=Novosphingobium TaxID=165696 RepID=UPI0022F27847|nr:GTP-binding protein [Novosphingobium resinovorum]GLK45708.1 ATP-binding protein [Novosphingobium resinovorum]